MGDRRNYYEQTQRRKCLLCDKITSAFLNIGGKWKVKILYVLSSFANYIMHNCITC